ncbi:hypothetical protein [Legionella waltersii]|uniref:Uncharacterized protein n=1 Tax=Legionella waltersii TaxID=66969 RepID=A0A0W1A147_9GAMM|nr:hypothetical protein [Legionella waltersii]KTD75070.1 hypothetical protein Lwal_3111 [Legionella waltersii]SNV05267.1 Uncharacterised protein [Legionella waltersii]
MAVSDSLDSLNEFLKSQTGVTEDLLDELFSETPSFSPIFFTPMTLKKCYAPISAPIALSLISLELLLDTMVYLLQGIYNLVINRSFQEFQKSMELSLKSVIFTAAMVLATVASPIINLVDFIGSIFTAAIGILCKQDENSNLTVAMQP